METINFLFDGFSVAFTVQNITLALIGCFLGTVFGALPGFFQVIAELTPYRQSVGCLNLPRRPSVLNQGSVRVHLQNPASMSDRPTLSPASDQ